MNGRKNGDILLALSPSRRSRETVERALELAKSEETGILLVFVVEEDTPNKIASYISDRGFMGEKASDIFKKSLLEEYRERGREEIASLEDRCRREGIPMKGRLRHGAFAEEILAAAEEARPRVIVVNKSEERTDLERWVFGSEVERIGRGAKCPVRIIEPPRGPAAPGKGPGKE